MLVRRLQLQPSSFLSVALSAISTASIVSQCEVKEDLRHTPIFSILEKLLDIRVKLF